MIRKTTIKLSENQDLVIPREIKNKLQPLSEYEITFTQDIIILKKIKQNVNNKPVTTRRKSSGKSILQHAETWESNDVEDCLQAVYDNRSEIRIITNVFIRY